MISYDAAMSLMLNHLQPLGKETVPIAAAQGRVLAEPLFARTDSPRHSVSAMDGYAVNWMSIQPGRLLDIAAESRAGGAPPPALEAGKVIRIFTGAPLPPGANAVIMQEYAERVENRVRFRAGFGPARHVRLAGNDFAAGAQLLPAGTRLGPRAMLVAAAADRAAVTVALQPRVAILATGDELTDPGTAFDQPGAIPESVSLGVAALAQDCGAQIVVRYRGGDDIAALTNLAAEALSNADVVVVTGGASVGDHDLAKPAFAALGLDTYFSKVAIKPGKPVWFGQAQGRWVLGLPGNPTSAMVTAALFLRPLLAAMQGVNASAAGQWQQFPLAAPLPATGDRETFTRALLKQTGLEPLSNQESGSQLTLLNADWLIRCPPGQSGLPAGTIVPAMAF
jgi:molybdopterin molybdotransferase